MRRIIINAGMLCDVAGNGKEALAAIEGNGGAAQVDSIKTRVEIANGSSTCNKNIIKCFQVLLSVLTCAASERQGGADLARRVVSPGTDGPDDAGDGRRYGDPHPPREGMAVHVEPMRSVLKAPGMSA